MDSTSQKSGEINSNSIGWEETRKHCHCPIFPSSHRQSPGPPELAHMAKQMARFLVRPWPAQWRAPSLVFPFSLLPALFPHFVLPPETQRCVPRWAPAHELCYFLSQQHPSTSGSVVLFDTVSCCVAHTGLELTIPLHWSLKCWNYTFVAPHLVGKFHTHRKPLNLSVRLEAAASISTCSPALWLLM